TLLVTQPPPWEVCIISWPEGWLRRSYRTYRPGRRSKHRPDGPVSKCRHTTKWLARSHFFPALVMPQPFSASNVAFGAGPLCATELNDKVSAVATDEAMIKFFVFM